MYINIYTNISKSTEAYHNFSMLLCCRLIQGKKV